MLTQSYTGIHSLTIIILHNYSSLCRRKSNSIKGLPFRPVSAVPVDLFPHTHHCELVILLERIKRHELSEQSGTSQSTPDGVATPAAATTTTTATAAAAAKIETESETADHS